MAVMIEWENKYVYACRILLGVKLLGQWSIWEWKRRFWVLIPSPITFAPSLSILSVLSLESIQWIGSHYRVHTASCSNRLLLAPTIFLQEVFTSNCTKNDATGKHNIDRIIWNIFEQAFFWQLRKKYWNTYLQTLGRASRNPSFNSRD